MKCWTNYVSIFMGVETATGSNLSSFFFAAHEIYEIRVRALHDIENKVKRALWEQQEIKFRPTSLLKNLIRWFGNVPICEETTVLELISLLLNVCSLHVISD